MFVYLSRGSLCTFSPFHFLPGLLLSPLPGARSGFCLVCTVRENEGDMRSLEQDADGEDAKGVID